MSRAPSLSLSKHISLAAAVRGIWVNRLKSLLQPCFVVDAPVKVALVQEVVELILPIGPASSDTGNFNVVNVRCSLEYIEERLHVRADRMLPTVNQRELHESNNSECDVGV